ncbi:MAG: quinone oxidoreductase [candidate division KSB1 bacterium]|nr:quinone oxidoreductase [candidate division KSB1 bacterium]MDZ7275085.1 quinone oxidoreductase [candidate division KSB1 bacterium]MDZ7286467.1 quinone oxidoreductase [candidate division KSB1 bacterium]MDZ7299369.1 quinone oxidoreductase [candidate division KSB1 bacterium]MDZ7306302.1 quinone oxidoreductase [candidate division KSB1 bacterium]
MKAIRIHQLGGAEVLQLEEIPVPEPGDTEVLIQVAVCGVNFIDVYYRTGLYKVPLPFTPGSEAAGVVAGVGDKVTEVQPGQRVAFAMTPGGYAEYVVVPAWRVVALPDALPFDLGAAVLLQGMTAHYLTQSVYPLKSGETCLVHAAAGGIGLMLVQMAAQRGARVIGTVSTEAKAVLARAAGAAEVILYTQQDFEKEVKRLTAGRGVEVVYDAVGKTTWEKSMNCLRPRGYLVLFGQASGPVPPIDPLALSTKGSLFMTRATLTHYTATREELLWRANDVFSSVMQGRLNVRIHRILPLAEARRAHELLESRQTTGKLLLRP